MLCLEVEKHSFWRTQFKKTVLLEILSSHAIGSVLNQQDKLRHTSGYYCVFFEFLVETGLPLLRATEEKDAVCPMCKIDHIMYRPGSKAFATHMHMLFWTSATFLLSQTKEWIKQTWTEIHTPFESHHTSFPLFNNTSYWSRRKRQNPELSGQILWNLICFSYATLQWPYLGEMGCS